MLRGCAPEHQNRQQTAGESGHGQELMQCLWARLASQPAQDRLGSEDWTDRRLMLCVTPCFDSKPNSQQLWKILSSTIPPAKGGGGRNQSSTKKHEEGQKSEPCLSHLKVLLARKQHCGRAVSIY